VAPDPTHSVSTGNGTSDAGVAADVPVLTEAPPTEQVVEPVVGLDAAPATSRELSDAERARLFEELVVPETDVLWRVALSITRNRADAEDVVQETLLRAFRSMGTFDGRYPRAWLLTILRNAERNRHRRRRPELLSDPEMAEDLGPRTESDEVEVSAEQHEFTDFVAQSVEALPEVFREVVDLVDINGLSYQEAADVLGVPIGTVMSRLHRARRRLREALVPAGFGPAAPAELPASAADDGEADE
jgi:RNA polymerase sigma-70 factor (ECF subfamily)